MKIISGCHNYRSQAGAGLTQAGTVLTIGNFDGLHLGHQRLIDSALQFASSHNKPSVLLTFDPHPLRILCPDKNHLRLCSLDTTKELLSRTGLDTLIVEPFTASFSQLSPQAFIKEMIVPYVKPFMIVVGHDFRFGAKSKGSHKLLDVLAETYSFRVEKIPAVKKDGHVVSSSLIKKLILSGEWNLIPQFLGRFFSIKGQVAKGQGRGRKMGVPTINLIVDKEQFLPINGVYISLVRKKNQLFQSVMNIGLNPTVSKEGVKKIEIHLIDKDIQWMDSECEVEILNYLRPEISFSGLSALVNQIKKDIAEAKKYFKIIDYFAD